MANVRKLIETVLATWDQAQAFALYEAHAPDGFTKDFLRGNNSSFAKEKLEKALRAFLADPTSGADTPPSALHTPHSAPADKPVPLAIAKFDTTWKPLYKQLAANRLMLRHCKTNDERYKMAVSMLHGWDQVYQIWRDMDYYERHGTLPPPKPEPEAPIELDYDTIDRAALAKRRTNLRSYKAKHRHNPAKAADIKAWDEEIEQINRILDNP